MPHLGRFNNHNTVRIGCFFAVGEFGQHLCRLVKVNTCKWHFACAKFGNSNNLITLSLSLSLSQALA